MLPFPASGTDAVLSSCNSALQEASPAWVQVSAACEEVYGFELPEEEQGKQAAKGI